MTFVAECSLVRIVHESKSEPLAQHGSEAMFRHRRRSRGGPSGMIRTFLFCLPSLLSLATLLLGFDCCQPVAALTSSSALSISSIHVKAISNSFESKVPATVVFGANEANTSGVNNNYHGHDGDKLAQGPQLLPGSRVSKVFAVACTLCASPILRVRCWKEQVQKGYARRINADPSFLGKSIAEVLVAAGTQLMAEWNRRGATGMIHELDFVVPAVLTAIAGKYYSMWRTAKTLNGGDETGAATSSDNRDPILFGRLPVPTNAFQPHMADGVTLPAPRQRLGSFLVSVPALFRAGIIASGVGYGIVSILLSIRTRLMPSFQTETIPVNALHASIYTGCFMAVVSNIRYQILQGVIEPIVIDRWIFSGIGSAGDDEGNETEHSNSSNGRRRQSSVALRSFVIFVVRWLNGLLGSVLAISGMRFLGLQRMKA